MPYPLARPLPVRLAPVGLAGFLAVGLAAVVAVRAEEPKAQPKPDANPPAAAAEGKAGDAKPGEAKSGDAKPAEPKPGGAEASEAAAVELFNGKDLTGWGYKGGPRFDGKAESDDKRYAARDGVLVVNPGKGLAQLWTTAEFAGDVELRLEFRAAVNADSGLFVRGPQLQVRDYLVAGPYKELKKYKPQEWNEVVVVVKAGVAHCTCNGEVLNAAMKVPATGPIGLEADRGQMEYRHLRLRAIK